MSPRNEALSDVIVAVLGAVDHSTLVETEMDLFHSSKIGEMAKVGGRHWLVLYLQAVVRELKSRIRLESRR
jgi:hypothetical protein